MGNTRELVRGLDISNITKRMKATEATSLIVLIIIFSPMPVLLIWAGFIGIEEAIDYIVFLPIGLTISVWGLMEGLMIFLFVSSFCARKVVFLLAKNQDYSALEELLSLRDFEGQYTMKQIDLFKMKYAVVVLGDLQYSSSLKYIAEIILCRKGLSWGLRRWAAIAVAKIGTAEAIRILTRAKSMFRHPNGSMTPRFVTQKLGSILIKYLYILRTYITVKRLLKKILKINGLSEEEENQMEKIERISHSP